MPIRPIDLRAHDHFVGLASSALPGVLHQPYLGIAAVARCENLTVATTRVVWTRGSAAPRELLEARVVVDIQHLDEGPSREGCTVDRLLVKAQGTEATKNPFVRCVRYFDGHVVAHS